MILSDRAALESRSIIFAFAAPLIYTRFRIQTFNKLLDDYVNFSEHAKSSRKESTRDMQKVYLL